MCSPLEVNRIYNMNCLEGILRIPAKSIDCMITDPPYSIGTTSTGVKGSWLDNNLVAPFYHQLFAEVRRVLRDGAYIYINTDWRTYPFLYPIVYEYFRIWNCIVWDYEWIKAGKMYRFSHEFIIFATNGDGDRAFPATERDVWRIKPINFTDTENKLHQAQKPTPLIRKMVRHGSDTGDTILDPFMGSGTTALVAAQEARNFIGFEISAEMAKVARARVGPVLETPRLDTFSKRYIEGFFEEAP